MKTFERSISFGPRDIAARFGHVMLRVLAGLMIFYIHGWHKLEGLVASLKDGTPWKLVEEVSGMHFPAPMISAIAATVIQFICSLLMTVGFLTRINAALLSGVLGVALLQNLLANRDPQLTIVYLLIVVFFAFSGAGEFSFDAKIMNKIQTDHKES